MYSIEIFEEVFSELQWKFIFVCVRELTAIRQGRGKVQATDKLLLKGITQVQIHTFPVTKTEELNER